MKHRQVVKRARRIVVKIGSSTLSRNGELRPRVFTDLARQVSELIESDRQVVLVSSGSIAVGRRELGWGHADNSIPEMQAAAAVGQIGLVELYKRRFARLDKKVAQVLLTRAGLEEREHFLNARRTLLELLRLGVVPIVNENDTVATEEIRFGDNDNLSATVVNLVGAELLIILTDVDGLHHEKPCADRPTPPLFDVIEAITPEIEKAAQGSDNASGRGGMITKLEAARTAARSGAATVVCRGRGRDTLLRVVAGESVGTLFLSGQKLNSRKHWLAFTARTRGELVIDPGAVRALLERGRSLLPAGVVEVRGNFRIGDSVTCVDQQGRQLARGLAGYSAEDVTRIRGLATREIPRVLGYSNGDEVIHRDNLVLLESESNR
ncbi:MAG: glutamate 5-kinase [Myxococcota bacterium]